MNSGSYIALLGICAGALLTSSQQVSARNAPPVIQHIPAAVALQGQSIVIRATVTDDVGVKSVTLYYSTSKDVAPFKLDMQRAGQDIFVCTVPDNLLELASIVTYYIEAIDTTDQTSETRWYTVSIQPAAPKPKIEVRTGSDGDSFWKTTALIGGGVVLAGGAAAIVVANSGGNSVAPPSSTTNAHAGVYVGSVTTQLEFPEQSPQTRSHGTTITIDAGGIVRSYDLYMDQTLTSAMSGSDFTLTANVNATNLTGQIAFKGSVVNGTINGFVGGTVQDTSGTNGTHYGTYYGNFYATKQ